MNPVLTYVRNHVPYPDKNPVGDDRPLTYAEINKWGRGYSDFHYHEVHFFGMIVRAFPYRWHVRLPVLHKVDRVVLRYAPPLRRLPVRVDHAGEVAGRREDKQRPSF
ncbi:MAG: hypothetical protein IPK17_00490 [Chloroflexi bacterium]|uniref:hypothetical protein n=1 Tax=Candidatus Flexifilum breve TaxID=3140694 RepID=UPI0031366742|nr:hypothetical protein [Chloroflexota bacterium]